VPAAAAASRAAAAAAQPQTSEGDREVESPPPLPPAKRQPLLQPVSEDDLKRRQAVKNLFTLYESQHLQMMKIKDLLLK
jgi:hypothetical protein